MDEIINNIEFNSLILSDFGRKTFTEKDLEKATDISKTEIVSLITKNKNIFNIISLKKGVCPNCKSQEIDIDTGMCGSCGEEYNINEIGQFRIDINKTEFEKSATDYIISIFKNNNWTLQKKECNLTILNRNNYSLVISFSLDATKLRDYYYLKGWLSDAKNVCYVIFSKSCDTELNNFLSKNPLAHHEDSANIYKKESRDLLVEKIEYSLDNIKQEKQFEKFFDGEFNDELNIQKLKQEFNTVLDNLKNLALHNNDLSPPQNGYKYQSSIIKLLNLTILPIKVLVKKNIQDVLIRIPQNYGECGKQVRWIPLEIKSFRPNPKVGPYFNIKKYCSQYRKYIQGYLDVKVRSVAQVECFVIFAYDFLNNDEINDSIDQIEIDFDNRIHITLFSQENLIYLIEKRKEQMNPLMDFDNIVRLFKKNRYLDKIAIDKFYNKINEDFKDSGEETTFKKVQERVHKMGK